MAMAPADTRSNESPFPPPQISDLLVLTLTTAYGMTWMSAFTADPQAVGVDWQARLQVITTTLLPGILFGIELFGFAVVIRELARGRRLAALSPGHWWFLIIGPQYLLGGTHLLIALICGTWLENRRDLFVMTESLTDASFYALFAAFWLWATSRLQGWQWRVVLGLKALEQLDWVAFQCYRAVRLFNWAPRISSSHFLGPMGTIHIGLILSVFLAAAHDRRSKIQRDWLHYLAAGAIVSESLLFLLGGSGWYLLRWWSTLWLYLFA